MDNTGSRASPRTHQARVPLWDYIDGFLPLGMPFFLTTLKIPEELPKRPSTGSHYLFLTYTLTVQQYLLSDSYM